MSDERGRIIDWAEAGRIAPDRVVPALRAAGLLPEGRHWRQFMDQLLLGLGGTLFAAGVIFFVAYNWNDLGRYTRFGAVQALIVVAVALCWKFDVDRPAGKAALATAALLVGALLALVGQTYQTGADTWELFAAWAALILPWIVVGRNSALWVGWLAIVNLATALYFTTFRGSLWWLGGPREMLWALFVLDTVALAVWELASRTGIAWMRDRWPPRLLVLASGAGISLLAMLGLFGRGTVADTVALVGWVLWVAAVYWIYRRLIVDLFALAVGVFSIIVVVTAGLIRGFHLNDNAGAFLFISLVVMALAAAGAWWLRRTAAEIEP